MLKSFNDVVGNRNIEHLSVEYSVSKGYYCLYRGKEKLDDKLLNRVEERMHNLVDENIIISKKVVKIDYAIRQFKKHGMTEKEKLFAYRRTSQVNMYDINGFEDYYYGYMVPSTGCLKYFKLYLFDEGFVLQMPVKENPTCVPEFKPQQKVANILKESSEWGNMLNINGVGDLNNEICKGNIGNVILVQEALQEKKIAEIANQIHDRKNVKFVMIAGPSSSGKTTFSHRLSIQLMALGLKPHPIPVDNYFINRADCPLDENGNKDYEILEAIDVEQFNKDMNALVRGERVELPVYNFLTGEREYNGDYLQLEDEDVLVIEGIHCLNDKLSYSLPKESKFKIYISALTQLNLDEHNRIPTTDARLLRRMVRDARTRGTSAKETIARWQSVRRGEENYIFPYQEEADAMFNSALIYELSVLKQYVEPLLFGIEKDCEEYTEAKRLLKFMEYFLGTSSEMVPNNSLLREFIGGSVFKC
jgi:uridine kinase